LIVIFYEKINTSPYAIMAMIKGGKASQTKIVKGRIII
jgi:hypothetical protein